MVCLYGFFSLIIFMASKHERRLQHFLIKSEIKVKLRKFLCSCGTFAHSSVHHFERALHGMSFYSKLNANWLNVIKLVLEMRKIGEFLWHRVKNAFYYESSWICSNHKRNIKWKAHSKFNTCSIILLDVEHFHFLAICLKSSPDALK